MKLFLLLLVCFIGAVYAHCPYGIDARGVSSRDKTRIVNKHNELRKLIANGKVRGQPRGVNLKRLKWHEGLARKAQEIANTCEFEHVSVKQDPFWWVGQNLYTGYSTGPGKAADWSEAIQAWFDENEVFTFGEGFGPDTGHYTQVVWADTEYVGCGFSYFKTGGAFPYQKLYVCNYGNGGNIHGQDPYKVGKNGCENLC